jgi:tRNA (guanine-N7-)-methyltransferase
MNRIGTETIKREWGFLHVERTFQIGEESAMLRLAMGSFDRPESCYVILEKGRTRYFPSLPVRSRANLCAHTLLNELLHG